MQIRTTTTVEVTDGRGREVLTVSRTERKDVGDNPRFFVPEGLPVVAGNAETVIINAARALDRASVERKVPHE